MILNVKSFNINSKLSPRIYVLSLPVNPNLPSSIKAPLKLALFDNYSKYETSKYMYGLLS